jgi:hypothetical protein
MIIADACCPSALLTTLWMKAADPGSTSLSKLAIMMGPEEVWPLAVIMCPSKKEIKPKISNEMATMQKRLRVLKSKFLVIRDSHALAVIFCFSTRVWYMLVHPLLNIRLSNHDFP